MELSMELAFLTSLIATWMTTYCAALMAPTSCSQTYYGQDKGVINGQGYPQSYGDFAFCNYAIQIPSEQSIQLTFTEVSMEETDQRLHDFVLLFDGADCMANRIAAVINTTNPNYISSGNHMTALFISDLHTNRKSFLANYAAVTKQSATKPIPPLPNNVILNKCGQELTEESRSFSYTVDDGYNRLCVWRITVSSGMKVQLSFTKINLTNTEDWIRVLDGADCGAKLLWYVGGNARNSSPPLLSTNNTVMVVLYSMNGIEGNGIDADYTSTTESTVEPTTSTTGGSQSSSSTTKEGTNAGGSVVTESSQTTLGAPSFSFSTLTILASCLTLITLRISLVSL